MKGPLKKILFTSVFICVCFFAKAQQRGYVFLNEYLPWTNNSCPSSAEFIEIMNFGPGPVDIGCYVVTDGDYAITIPPNTIIEPGKFFVLGGMDTIRIDCANIDSAVITDLNWTTCNCASAAIPTTGDGFLTDGGSANEQIVFLDPNLQVVDAVARNLPVETSAAITTNSLSGQCSSHSFDLDTMHITYETIGESAGRGNSFARQVDGDCDWDKETQQSGGASNNSRGTKTPTLTASIYTTQNFDCPNSPGSIVITFDTPDPSSLFPIKYILVADVNHNYIYEMNDVYTSGEDISGPSFELTGLSEGTYMIALEPVTGCNYKLFSFSILPCNTVVTPITLNNLNVSCSENATISWNVFTTERVDHFEIESAAINNEYYRNIQTIYPQKINGTESFGFRDITANKPMNYRIKTVEKSGHIYYSKTVNCGNTSVNKNFVVFPNPIADQLNITLPSDKSGIATLHIVSADGRNILQQQIKIEKGSNNISLPVKNIPKGTYCVKIYQENNIHTQRIIKL